MVVGFNHNFRYRGELYHVQTEDGGLKNPQVVTLLYRGGTILAAKKTSYADILRVEKLEQAVEELMKDQHRQMLRRLKGGEFDAIIAARFSAASPGPKPQAKPEAPPEAPAEKDTEAPPEQAPSAAGDRQEGVLETSLDEIILSYLMGDGEENRKP